MKSLSKHTSGLALSLGLTTALGGCMEPSPCLDAEEYDFPSNPQKNSETPTLGSTSIPLHFNILYYDGVEIEDIRDGIRRDLSALNYAFSPLDVAFYPSGITEIQDNGVREFIRSMNQDNSGESFDLQLSRHFMSAFPEAKGFPVFYFPKTNENDGLAGRTAPFIYYANPDYADPWSRKDGYASIASGLAHEIGHILKLEHPFSQDGKGDDGLSDTLDYAELCGIEIGDWSPYPVETSIEDGVCYVGCLDTCGYKAPANVMDYFHCDQDLPMGFSPQQEQIMSRALQDSKNPLFKYVNKDLPKVSLK